MRKNGSVTVFFSLVFLIMFSFLLSFFEMAAYTARGAYHAASAALAVENYFAAYLRPLYDEYHIFGREVPEKEDITVWTEAQIAEDVAYMTVKQETEKSLLRRSGASFEVTSASVLTDGGLEGFHSQAVTAMKYRGVTEAVDIIKAFAGVTESANAHMEIAAAKAATDSAYAKVDEKLLRLIELVDGVDSKRYEKFLKGKGSSFLKDTYVKCFCVNPQNAAVYFDRAEVYLAFLESYENPYEKLESLSERADRLADEMEERVRKEVICRSRLAAVRGQLAVIAEELSLLSERLSSASSAQWSLTMAMAQALLQKDNEAQVAAMSEQLSSISQAISEMQAQMNQLEKQEKELEKEIKQLEKEQKELEKKKEEQEKQAEGLMNEEAAFVDRCKTVCGLCEETYSYAREIQEELERAKKVKASCEEVLNSLQSVIGEEAVQEYRKDLDRYLFYEVEDGFDFNGMKQTVLENKSSLWNISRQIRGIDIGALRAGAAGLRNEKGMVANYSFEGLRLDYGELSLEENKYDGIEASIAKKVAKGFLGFLTEKEISEKTIETAYLPSGFRYEEDTFDLFSLLGTDMSGIFKELQSLLPKDLSPEGIINELSDTMLFHSYLATHFQNFSGEKEDGALAYEQEYLIVGGDADEKNLSSVVMRICAIRTVLHFISLYSDSTRKATVEQAALAVCGVIGLPALKGVMVFLLLLVWALEEAMIDTAAYLQGKRLLLYPGKTGGSLTFPEIVLFSGKFIKEKAKQKESMKGLAFGYNEFLHLFLFLTSREDKIYRAADLIQENLRHTYRDSFRLNRCVWKITYRTDKRAYEYAYK